MVTPILERDDKSRKLLKDYQDAATQTARMKLLNERIEHNNLTQVIKDENLPKMQRRETNKQNKRRAPRLL